MVAFVGGILVGAFLWYTPYPHTTLLPSPNIDPPAKAPEAPRPPPPSTPPPYEEHLQNEDLEDPAVAARKVVDDLFRRQSKTLEQAKSRYRLKNKRDPPSGYEDFFKFAQEKKCLIDEYDRIHRDFEPFYQLAEKDPKMFQRRVKESMKLAEGTQTRLLTSYRLDTKGPRRTHNFWTPFSGEWERTMRKMASAVGPIDLVYNVRDEPRVLFNTRLPDAMDFAMKKEDNRPFDIDPKPTDKFYSEPSRHQCLVPNSNVGFGNITNDVNGFMLYSSSTGFTTDFFPMLSQTKIEPCFSDILVPSSYYYYSSGWSSKHTQADPVPWEKKKPILYWRGSTTGGSYWHGSYHNFPRFRFLKMVKQHPDLLDGAFTGMRNCGAECPEAEIRKEYGILSNVASKEEEFNYRFLFDVDGNTFSGRFLRQLRGDSLVFKSTIFTEFFEDWLKPYEHFIPVLPDLSDIVERVQWALKNDKEARRIQKMGKEFSNRVITDDQNDCYYYLVLLEYARLYKMADL